MWRQSSADASPVLSAKAPRISRALGWGWLMRGSRWERRWPPCFVHRLPAIYQRLLQLLRLLFKDLHDHALLVGYGCAAEILLTKLCFSPIMLVVWPIEWMDWNYVRFPSSVIFGMISVPGSTWLSRKTTKGLRKVWRQSPRAQWQGRGAHAHCPGGQRAWVPWLGPEVCQPSLYLTRHSHRLLLPFEVMEVPDNQNKEDTRTE